MEVFWACIKANVKQMNVVQFILNEESEIPDRSIFIDMSYMQTPEGLGAMSRANRQIVVDKFTKFRDSIFSRKIYEIRTRR